MRKMRTMRKMPASPPWEMKMTGAMLVERGLPKAVRGGQTMSNVKGQNHPVCGGRGCGNRMVALGLRKHSDGGERSNGQRSNRAVCGGDGRGNRMSGLGLRRPSNG